MKAFWRVFGPIIVGYFIWDSFWSDSLYEWLLNIGLLVGIASLVAWGAWLRTGWLGLEQWPNPHGRYYRQWLSLPQGAGDYYEWLATQKGNREPWRTWAERARTLGV